MLCAGFVLTLGFGVSKALADLATLDGGATYRERDLVPKDALLKVELVSIADAAAVDTVLASILIKPGAERPIPFGLLYDPEIVVTNRTYGVRASLLVDGQVAFSSIGAHPILKLEGRDWALVMMEKVRRPGRSQDANLPPAGTTWLVEDIAGKGVLDIVQTTLAFDEDGGVHGSGGCNRFTGTLSVNESGMTMGPFAVTPRMCPPAVMNQEAAFLRALEEARSVYVEEPFLYLSDESGLPLLRLTQVQ